MKIVVLSFKNEDRQKSIRNQIQRSPFFFHDFAVALGALADILDVLGPLVLEVDLPWILKRSLG